MTIHKINEQLASIENLVPHMKISFQEMTNDIFHNEDKIENHKIALAIAMYSNSQDCIDYHLEFLLQNNFTKKDFCELLKIVSYMGGGVGLASGLKALKVFDK